MTTLSQNTTLGQFRAISETASLPHIQVCSPQSREHLWRGDKAMGFFPRLFIFMERKEDFSLPFSDTFQTHHGAAFWEAALKTCRCWQLCCHQERESRAVGGTILLITCLPFLAFQHGGIVIFLWSAKCWQALQESTMMVLLLELLHKPTSPAADSPHFYSPCFSISLSKVGFVLCCF